MKSEGLPLTVWYQVWIFPSTEEKMLKEAETSMQGF